MEKTGPIIEKDAKFLPQGRQKPQPLQQQLEDGF